MRASNEAVISSIASADSTARSGSAAPSAQRSSATDPGVGPQGERGDDGPPLVEAPGQQRLAGGERLAQAAQLLGARRLGSGRHRRRIGLDQLALPRRPQRDRRQRRPEDRDGEGIRRPQQALAGRQRRRNDDRKQRRQVQRGRQQAHRIPERAKSSTTAVRSMSTGRDPGDHRQRPAAHDRRVDQRRRPAPAPFTPRRLDIGR